MNVYYSHHSVNIPLIVNHYYCHHYQFYVYVFFVRLFVWKEFYLCQNRSDPYILSVPLGLDSRDTPN